MLTGAVGAAKSAYNLYQMSKTDGRDVLNHIKDARKLHSMKKKADTKYTGETYISLHPTSKKKQIQDCEWIFILPSNIHVSTPHYVLPKTVPHKRASARRKIDAALPDANTYIREPD